MATFFPLYHIKHLEVWSHAFCYPDGHLSYWSESTLHQSCHWKKIYKNLYKIRMRLSFLVLIIVGSVLYFCKIYSIRHMTWCLLLLLHYVKAESGKIFLWRQSVIDFKKFQDCLTTNLPCIAPSMYVDSSVY